MYTQPIAIMLNFLTLLSSLKYHNNNLEIYISLKHIIDFCLIEH